MAEGSSGLSSEVILKKWEQMAILEDCVLTRNRHQVLEDENLAKELQKEFDEEIARDMASHSQDRNSSDSEIEDSLNAPEIPQVNAERQRVEINGMDRQGRLRPNRSLPDPSLDYEALNEIVERLGPAKHPGLRQFEIDLLPKRCFQPKDVTEGKKGTKTCQICLFQWKCGDSIKSLPCFHEFHAKCINNWLKINKSCPVCRLDIKFRDD